MSAHIKDVYSEGGKEFKGSITPPLLLNNNKKYLNKKEFNKPYF